ncbi:hypothetical protein [Streptomyces sp. NPDC005012]|uniref:hypothetical protein n=1 Tax=unclassified Streptomyces TaxID=2593676 RepID=UPI0033B8079D
MDNWLDRDQPGRRTESGGSHARRRSDRIPAPRRPGSAAGAAARRTSEAGRTSEAPAASVRRPDERTVQLRTVSLDEMTAQGVPLGEVTVQLSAVTIGDQRLGVPASAEPAAPDHDGPVFVDVSGRRVRRFRLLGAVIGLACAAFAAAIVVTLLSQNSSAPWLPVPEQKPRQEAPAQQAETTPSPDAVPPSASPSGDDAPVAEPGPGTVAEPGPGTVVEPADAASLPFP